MHESACGELVLDPRGVIQIPAWDAGREGKGGMTRGGGILGRRGRDV